MVLPAIAARVGLGAGSRALGGTVAGGGILEGLRRGVGPLPDVLGGNGGSGSGSGSSGSDRQPGGLGALLQNPVVLVVAGVVAALLLDEARDDA